MNNQTESTNKQDSSKTNEAELMAEILLKLNEKQKSGSNAANGQRRQNPQQTIDLIELFYYFLSKLHYLILGMIAGGVIMGFYASTLTPIYVATSKLYLIGDTGNSIIADLQIGTILTKDYQEVFKTWEVHQMVNEQLGTNYPYGALQGMLSISNPENTRVLYIRVHNSNPQLAADIANAYGTAAKKFIMETMKTDEPSTFSVALVPSVPSSTGSVTYIIRGMLVGTILVGGILLLFFLLDNRPKCPDDITKAANIPVLAVIPANKELSGDKKYRKAGNR